MLSIHADEFNELIGEEFVPLLNKAGGAGYQVTAYTQTWSDVEARIGSRAKAGQVAGNFNTLIMLRVRELATAEMLTRQLKEVPLYSLSQNSGVSDSSEPLSPVDFVARNEDRLTMAEAPLLTPGDLMELPKGQAFALLEGGQLWKIRIPLPEARDDPCMPQSLAAIAQDMGRAAERAAPHFPRRSTPMASDNRSSARPRHPAEMGLIARTLHGTVKLAAWLVAALPLLHPHRVGRDAAPLARGRGGAQPCHARPGARVAARGPA